MFCDLSKVKSKIDYIIAGGERCAYFEPLNPVVAGHLLVIPVRHVDDAMEDPTVTGAVMKAAAHVAARYESANIITSIGEPATQSVMHLHLHIVPRAEGDGLLLPWHREHP